MIKNSRARYAVKLKGSEDMKVVLFSRPVRFVILASGVLGIAAYADEAQNISFRSITLWGCWIGFHYFGFPFVFALFWFWRDAANTEETLRASGGLALFAEARRVLLVVLLFLSLLYFHRASAAFFANARRSFLLKEPIRALPPIEAASRTVSSLFFLAIL